MEINNQTIFREITNKYSVRSAVSALVMLECGSASALARELGCSHTAVNSVIAGKLRSDVAEYVFCRLGINNPYS